MEKSTENALKLTAPSGIAALFLFVSYLHNREIFTFSLIYFLTPLGRFAIYLFAAVTPRSTATIFGNEIYLTALSLDLREMLFAVVVVDTPCSWFLIWNFDYSKRISLIGEYLKGIERAGVRIV